MRIGPDRLLPGAILLLLVVGPAGTGCRGGDAEQLPAADDSSPVNLDGEGMEPRIVTEHPIDAPGRPADGASPSPAITPVADAAWIPHLEVADLGASIAFYRDLGFIPTVGAGDEAATRVDLVRDGVRLVLVAAPPREEGADRDRDAGETAAAAPSASVVLHLSDDEADASSRRVSDPDGHRLVLPGPG